MRVKRLSVFLSVIFLIFNTFLFAQKTVTVKKVEGRWEVSEDITMKQAEERAFLEAKKTALQEAGVMENVWSVFGQISQENGQEFHEAYSQMSVLAISGMVNVTDKKVDKIWDEQAKRLYEVVTINATVKKEDKTDSEYALEVKGIEPIYKIGEHFQCRFRVHGTDSFLKFFWFDNSGGAMLYPNDYEKKMMLKAGEEYTIPFDNSVDYTMEKQDKNLESEKINIMMVATKTNIPFTGSVSYANVLKWIYSIPAEQRCSFYEMILIK